MEKVTKSLVNGGVLQQVGASKQTADARNEFYARFYSWNEDRMLCVVNLWDGHFQDFPPILDPIMASQLQAAGATSKISDKYIMIIHHFSP